MRHFAAITLICLSTLIGCVSDDSGATSPRVELRMQSVGTEGQRGRLHLKDEPCATVLAAPVPISVGVVRQLDQGTCKLPRLGTVIFVSDKVLQLRLGTQTIKATFTTADGDVLRAVGTGTNTPSGPGKVVFAATIDFVGGTGKFAAATGRARSEGEADLIARTSTSVLNGFVVYDKSDRDDR